jgi:hypothetical protein
MTGDEPQYDTALERRYRRLLACYPWEHRRVYEDEMLAVLLADARPGQRWPAPGDVTNLVATAVRARLWGGVRQVGDRYWLDAAAVFGLLGAILLLAWQVTPVLDRAAWAWGADDLPRNPWLADPALWLRIGLWSLVVAAVLVGIRWLAASLAWVAVLLDVAVLGTAYTVEPVTVVHALSPLVFGAVCAGALTAPSPRRAAVAVLGWPRFLFFAASSLLMLVAAGWRAYGYGDAGHLPILPVSLSAALFGLAVVLAAVVGRGVPAPVRRRGLVLLAPVLAFYLVVRLALAGWTYSNGHLGHPVYLVPIQWTLLAVVPLLVFAAGLVLVRRREQTLRLLALGRDTDRRRSDP